MKAHQIETVLFHLFAALAVALSMLLTVQGLLSVSHHHIERQLAGLRALPATPLRVAICADSHRASPYRPARARISHAVPCPAVLAT